MSKIPRFRPALSIPSTVGILQKAFVRSSQNGDVREGRRFEHAFADYIGVKNAVSVPSGRMGLYLILKNLGLEAASEVILPAFTYWVVPRIVAQIGCKPVFVDIDAKTCNIDPVQIEQQITRSSRVILPTHLYGLPCRMEQVLSLAKKHHLLVVEDCVQACGARYQGRTVGSFGEAAYFGFGITKNVPLLGGGMVVTDNDSLAEQIRAETGSYGFVSRGEIGKKAAAALALEIFNHPRLFPYVTFPLIYASSFLGRDVAGKAFEEKEEHFEDLPRSYRRIMPPAVQAVPGLAQLMRLEGRNQKRIQNALCLLQHLKGIAGITLPPQPEDAVTNIFTNFPIRSSAREALAKELLRRGVDTSFGYQRALHAGYPHAAALEREILHLPVHPSLSEGDLLHICRVLQGLSKRVCA